MPHRAASLSLFLTPFAIALVTSLVVTPLVRRIAGRLVSSRTRLQTGGIAESSPCSAASQSGFAPSSASVLSVGFRRTR
jgi:hypothetical protein